jgi:hypothetical protein
MQSRQLLLVLLHKIIICILFGIISISGAFGQFAPAARRIGSTAIPADSNSIKSWAVWGTINRGYLNIADKSLGYADFGSLEDGFNKSDGNVVSLGDGGEVVLGFKHPIYDGYGFDFAIFENAFNDYYLEFGFVEVSSDGKRFVRFPAQCLTDTTKQLDNFSYSDPTKINNLAGKYRAGFGTPFDLKELKDSSGLNINRILYVKIIDVVGDISAPYQRRDSKNHIINDPYPTPFPSCGFDLDAVGVINETSEVGIENNEVNIKSKTAIQYSIEGNQISFYLNGFQSEIPITIYDVSGKFIRKYILQSGQTVVSWEPFAKGIYLLAYPYLGKKVIQKIFIY